MGRNLIGHWEPESPGFWLSKGRATAGRNLWISVPALVLSYAVWAVWSVVVLYLPEAGFNYSANQLFWLAALPGLSGALLRIFYAFLVPVFGGRRWTAVSTASLLIPAAGIGFAVRDPATGYPTMLILALLCGLGGGNFASSMANISFFFPNARRARALSINARLGSLGVPVAQLVVPLAIGAGIFGALGGDPQSWSAAGEGRRMWLQNAGFIWVPFIALAALAAWLGMNDLASARTPFSEQAVVFKRKHNWLMCWLSLGSFGSFIGFAAAFPLLGKILFPQVDPLHYAFLGPLAGALAPLAGGWVSKRRGGAWTTFWSFAAMAGALAGAIHFLPQGTGAGSFAGFLAMFLLLFTAAGVGNASTSRMIPEIFLQEHLRTAGRDRAARARATVVANKEAGAAFGFTSALAACGAFFIPKSLGTSISLSGRPEAALWCFIGFYASCIAITWWFYLRHGSYGGVVIPKN